MHIKITPVCIRINVYLNIIITLCNAIFYTSCFSVCGSQKRITNIIVVQINVQINVLGSLIKSLSCVVKWNLFSFLLSSTHPAGMTHKKDFSCRFMFSSSGEITEKLKDSTVILRRIQTRSNVVHDQTLSSWHSWKCNTTNLWPRQIVEHTRTSINTHIWQYACIQKKSSQMT